MNWWRSKSRHYIHKLLYRSCPLKHGLWIPGMDNQSTDVFSDLFVVESVPCQGTKIPKIYDNRSPPQLDRHQPRLRLWKKDWLLLIESTEITKVHVKQYATFKPTDGVCIAVVIVTRPCFSCKYTSFI